MIQPVTGVKWPEKGGRAWWASFRKWSLSESSPPWGRGTGERRTKAQCGQGGGWCLHRHPGETDSNPTLSAFPPQGEKGAAGSPGLLGLLGQKVGIDEL